MGLPAGEVSVDTAVEIGVVVSPSDRAAVFALRMLVFVEEQRVPPEEELDAYDVTATHFFVRVSAGDDAAAPPIVGTARLVDKGSATGKIGRVAIHADYRGKGLGAALMQAIHDYAAEHQFHRLVLEAQCYAIPFYEKLGYTAEGDVFLDANIEHRNMWRELRPDSGPRTPAMAARVSTR